MFGVLLLAMSRPARYEGVAEIVVLPKRVDSPQDGPYARAAMTSGEIRAAFAEFLGGDEEWYSPEENAEENAEEKGEEGGAERGWTDGEVERLRKGISMEVIGDEGSARLRAVDAGPGRAAVLAGNLAQGFREYLEDVERERRQMDLAGRKETLAGLEGKLNALRQAILSFHRLHLEAVEKYGGENREDWRQGLLVEQTGGRIGVLEERLEALEGKEPGEFLKLANRWKIIDQGLMALATEYLDHSGTVRALDESGLSKTHVELVASRERQEGSKQRLEAGLERLLAKMREEIKQEKDHRAALLAEREETWALLGEIAMRVEETRGIYAGETAALAQAQAGLYAAQLEASLPVRVVEFDPARGVALERLGPSFLTDLILAPVMGMLCGGLTVLVRAWRRGRMGAPEQALSGWAGSGAEKESHAVAA